MLLEFPISLSGFRLSTFLPPFSFPPSTHPMRLSSIAWNFSVESYIPYLAFIVDLALLYSVDHLQADPGREWGDSKRSRDPELERDLER